MPQRRYRVVKFDLAGHGRSHPTDDKFELSDFVDQFVSVLNLFGDNNAIVVGHSLGGVIATLAAARFRCGIARLVLLNVPFARSNVELHRARERIEKVRIEGLGAVAPSIVSRWFPSRYLDERPNVRLDLEIMLAKQDQSSFIASYRAALEGDDAIKQAAPKISVDVVAATGLHDTSATPNQVKQLSTALKAKYIEFKETGHMSPIQVPNIIEQLITGS